MMWTSLPKSTIAIAETYGPQVFHGIDMHSSHRGCTVESGILPDSNESAKRALGALEIADEITKQIEMGSGE